MSTNRERQRSLRFTDKQIAKLSVVQRNTIIRHVPLEVVPFNVEDAPTIRVLLNHRILKPVPFPGQMQGTSLTMLGRRVACQLLAEYAEALISAGAGRTPLEQLLSLPKLPETENFLSSEQKQSETLVQVSENIDETADVPNCNV